MTVGNEEVSFKFDLFLAFSKFKFSKEYYDLW